MHNVGDCPGWVHHVRVTLRLPRLLLAAAVTVLMLFASGCGGDDEVTPTAGGSSPTETTTAPTPSPSAPTTSSGLGGTPAPSETDNPTPTRSPSEPTTPSQPTKAPPTQEPPTNAPPTTYDEALALFDQASGSQKFSRFASPSGNLYCVLDSPYLPPSCELGNGAIRDPATCPDDGPSQSVGRIEFTDAAPQPICNSDTIREPGPPVLGYGGIATWPDTTVTCVMEEFGVTCVNPPANQGFFLAKGRYQIFGG
ncbi:hypothetical protein BH09ACT12_BH09ACT12_37690 [soil metagenome]